MALTQRCGTYNDSRAMAQQMQLQTAGPGAKSSRSSSSASSRKNKKGKKKRKKKQRRKQESSSSSSPGSRHSKSGEAAGNGQEVTNPDVADAKAKALEQLLKLRDVEPQDARRHEWRKLLRKWHPDKNPEQLEVATAVFQFLQKGRTVLSLA